MNLALSALPILVAFNPWVSPFVFGKGTYLLQRILLNVPAFQITALAVGGVLLWGRRGRWGPKIAAALMVFLWAKLFVVGANAWMAHTRALEPTHEQGDYGERIGTLMEFIDRRVPKGSVVLSDPVTSYMLSAYCDIKVVAPLHQHGNPNDPLGMERLKVIRDVMSPYTTQGEVVVAIGMFGVDYVIANGAHQRRLHDYLADFDPDHVAVLREKLGLLKSMFRKIYDLDGIVVYEVIGGATGGNTWYPIVPFIQPTEFSYRPCIVDDLAPHLQVRGVSVYPEAVLPGEDVRIRVAYRKNQDVPFSLPITLVIRMECTEYFESARSFPGDKYLRRFREAREGTLVRHRVDRTPFNGMFAPDIWPLGEYAYEEFIVRLPSNLREAEYDVQFKLAVQPLLPNYTVRDLLYNDDSQVGVACSRISVKKFIAR
jgi:hypothetical protein